MSSPRRTNRHGETAFVCSTFFLLILGLFIVLIGTLLVSVGAVRLHVGDKNCGESPTLAVSTVSKLTRTSCDFSTEAVRVGLPALLEEVQNTYYEHHPHNIAWKPDLRGEEVEEYVKTRCEVEVDMLTLVYDLFVPTFKGHFAHKLSMKQISFVGRNKFFYLERNDRIPLTFDVVFSFAHESKSDRFKRRF